MPAAERYGGVFQQLNQDNTDRCHVSENVESWRRQQMYSGGVNFSLFERERKKTADALV